jgi:hypothetical protein
METIVKDKKEEIIIELREKIFCQFFNSVNSDQL